jgi:NADH:ubiquinone oxidoreductase subunit B-like Fe-S oxidoreductase
VAGCPPRPENVIGAIVKIQEKISNESIRNWR